MSDKYTAEQLHKPHFRGSPSYNPSPVGESWAGRATIPSGSGTVVVSTALVGSDSLVFLTMQATTRQSSGVAAPVEVTTISPGISFTIGYSGSETPARATTVMWWLFRGSD